MPDQQRLDLEEKASSCLSGVIIFIGMAPSVLLAAFQGLLGPSHVCVTGYT